MSQDKANQCDSNHKLTRMQKARTAWNSQNRWCWAQKNGDS